VSSVALARAFADALNGHDDSAAANLMAEDVELVFAHGSIQGRQAWLDMRARRPAPEHMEERVEDAEFTETETGAEMEARLVQRWIESGEVAGEQPLRVAFTTADGAINRIEFLAG
jgi:hypothetical protein